MSQAYDKFTSKVTSSIRSTFPSHIRKQDINYTLGYFMAVFKLVDMALIKSTHACLLISDAIRKTFEGLVELNRQQRVEAPLSALTVGVKCGGSDGFSGISANLANSCQSK